jgi:hypothetical protein
MTRHDEPITDSEASPTLSAITRRMSAFAVVLVLAVVCLLVAPAASPAATAAAQSTTTTTNTTNISDKAPYYANESPAIANQSWIAGRSEATLPNMTSYLTDIGTFVIGGGVAAQGGGSAGALLTGLVVAGVFVLAIGRAPVGSVGGTVLSVSVGGALTFVGLAPQWMYGLLVVPVAFVFATLLINNLR